MKTNKISNEMKKKIIRYKKMVSQKLINGLSIEVVIAWYAEELKIPILKAKIYVSNEVFLLQRIWLSAAGSSIYGVKKLDRVIAKSILSGEHPNDLAIHVARENKTSLLKAKVVIKKIADEIDKYNWCLPANIKTNIK